MSGLSFPETLTPAFLELTTTEEWGEGMGASELQGVRGITTGGFVELCFLDSDF